MEPLSHEEIAEIRVMLEERRVGKLAYDMIVAEHQALLEQVGGMTVSVRIGESLQSVLRDRK